MTTRRCVLSPESPVSIVVLDEGKCVGCGLCVLACPCHAIRIVDGLPVFHCGQACSHSDTCVAALQAFQPCESACPVGAISCAIEIHRPQPTDIMVRPDES